MQVWRRPKAPYLLIVFSVVLFACLLLYRSSNPAKRNVKSWLPRTHSNAESRKLVELLRRATMPDRTVILTIINQAWSSPGSILDLFLESFRTGQGTQSLLNHLVIVTVDGQVSHQYCKSIHPHCFHLTTSEINSATEKPFMNSSHLKLSWRLNELLREVLELGYNFLFTAADVMWLRNPFSHFEPLSEMQIACDSYTGDPQSKSNRADLGFFYVRSNEITLEFFKYWYMARFLHPNLHDQSVFEIIKHDKNVKIIGLRIKYLDTAYFSGICQPSKDSSRICTINANCCDSTEKKVHDLRLVLDDWRNFTALSMEENSLAVSSSWRTPSKCK